MSSAIDRVGVEAGQAVLQRLLARDLGAEARLEESPGRLAGTEPGDAHLAGELAERGVDRRLELVRRDRDVELDLVLEGFDRGLHRAAHNTPPWSLRSDSPGSPLRVTPARPHRSRSSLRSPPVAPDPRDLAPFRDVRRSACDRSCPLDSARVRRARWIWQTRRSRSRRSSWSRPSRSSRRSSSTWRRRSGCPRSRWRSSSA